MPSIKPFVVLPALTMVLAACGSTGTDTTQTDTSTASARTSAAPDDDVYTVGLGFIGIFGQVVTFIEGFKEALADAGLVEGENLVYVEHNAQNDQSVVPLMARQLVDENPDVIMAFGTPVIIALAQETESIPIVFGAMADPLSAGVIDDVEAPGTNLTGTSNFLDPALVLGLVRETLRDAENVGMILNPGEQNSANQLDALEAAAPSFGFDVVTAPVATTGDVVTAARSLEGRVDAVVLLQDNTVSEAYESVADTLIQARIPIFVASELRVEEGLGLVGIGLDARQVGVVTGEQVVQILLEGANPAQMPVIFANTEAGGGFTLAVNLAVAELLGIEVPDSLVERAEVYEETPYGD